MKHPVYASSEVPAFRFPFCPEYTLCSSKSPLNGFHLDCSKCDLKKHRAEKCRSLWELTSYAEFIKTLVA